MKFFLCGQIPLLRCFPILQLKMVVLFGLEPKLGSYLLLLVYKTSDAALHHNTKNGGIYETHTRY